MVALRLILSSVFTDANGDALTFTAESDNIALVTVAVSETTVAVTEEKGTGTATITVTADDGNGGTVSDDFILTITNQAPTVASAIADELQAEGYGSFTVDLSSVFTDFSDDLLTFTAESDNEGLATVTVSGTTLTVSEVGTGTVTITVTADDGNGGTVNDDFRVINATADATALQITMNGNTVNSGNHLVEVQLFNNNELVPLDTELITGTASINGEPTSVLFDGQVNAGTYLDFGEASPTIIVYNLGQNYIFDEVRLHVFDKDNRTYPNVTVEVSNDNEGTYKFVATQDVSDNAIFSLTQSAPTVASAVADMTQSAGYGSFTVDLSSVFVDSNGDTLTFTAELDNTSLAMVTVSGTILTVSEVSGTGTATITVTANDGNGGTVSDDFILIVTNQVPIVVSSIADESQAEGYGSFMVDLSSVFTDANGDILTFIAESSDTALVTVAASGTILTVSEVRGTGASTITVTADDGNGGTVSDDFRVINAASDATVLQITMNGNTRNPNNHLVEIELFNNNQLVPLDIDLITATVGINGVLTSVLFDGNRNAGSFIDYGSASPTLIAYNLGENYTFDEVRLHVFDGDIRTYPDVTVEISNDHGITYTTIATQDVSDNASFSLTSSAPIVVRALADTTQAEGYGNFMVDLSKVFTDANGDSLALTVESDNKDLATVTASGTRLIVSEVSGTGTATITVTADDGNGGTVSDDFRVTVNIFAVFGYRVTTSTPNGVGDVVLQIAEGDIFDGDSTTDLLAGITATGSTPFNNTFERSLINVNDGIDEFSSRVYISQFTTETKEVQVLGTTPLTFANQTIRIRIATHIFSRNRANGLVVSLLDTNGRVIGTPSNKASGFVDNNAAHDGFIVDFDATTGAVIQQPRIFDLEGSLPPLIDPQAPTVASAIADVTKTETYGSFTVNLSSVFTDANGNALTFTAESSDTSLAMVTVSGTILTVSEVRGTGTATITVIADDGNGDNGGTVSDDFILIVTNQAPTVASAIADTTQTEEYGSFTVDLRKVFTDANVETLTFTVESDNTSLAMVTVSGTILTVSEVSGTGTATITVTADDGNGGTVSDEFTLTVIEPNSRLLVFGYRVTTSTANQGSNVVLEIVEGDIFNGDSTTDLLAGITATGSTPFNDGNSLREINDGRDQFGVYLSQFTTEIKEVQVLGTTALAFSSGMIRIRIVSSSNQSDNNGIVVTLLDANGNSIGTPSNKASGFVDNNAAHDGFIVDFDATTGAVIQQPRIFDLEGSLPPFIDPQAPTVASAIADVTKTETYGSFTVNLSSVFTDANGNALTFTAESSDTSLAMVTVSGTILTVSEVRGTGTATITVIADDGNGDNGGTVSDDFILTVTNQAPTVASAIADLTQAGGYGSFTVDLSSVFTDANGDALTFTAESDNEGLATVAVSGAILTVSEASGTGTATITVTADDGNGGSIVSDDFILTVKAFAVFGYRVTASTANQGSNVVLKIVEGDIFNGDSTTDLLAVIKATGSTPFSDGNSLREINDGRDQFGSYLSQFTTEIKEVQVLGTTALAFSSGMIRIRIVGSDFQERNNGIVVTLLDANGNSIGTPSNKASGFINNNTAHDGFIVDFDATTGAVIQQPRIFDLEGSLPPLIDPQAPTVASAIADVTKTETYGSFTVNLSFVFTDANGNALTFTAESSDTSLAMVTVSGTILTVSEVRGTGTATITVIADDGNGDNGGTVSDDFILTVTNQAPTVASAIADLTQAGGYGSFTVDLSSVFTDANGDALTFTAESDNEGLATVAVSGAILTVSEASGTGTATITVTADDGNGGSIVSDDFILTVTNQAPTVANSIADMSQFEGYTSFTVELSSVFTDSNGDALTFTAESDNTALITLAVSGTTVIVTEVNGTGTATIIVTADDGNGGTVSDEFTLTIVDSNSRLPVFGYRVTASKPNDGSSNNSNIILQVAEGDIFDGESTTDLLAGVTPTGSTIRGSRTFANFNDESDSQASNDIYHSEENSEAKEIQVLGTTALIFTNETIRIRIVGRDFPQRRTNGYIVTLLDVNGDDIGTPSNATSGFVDFNIAHDGFVVDFDVTTGAVIRQPTIFNLEGSLPPL